MIPPRIILRGDQEKASTFVRFGSFLLDGLQQNINRFGLFQLSTFKRLPDGGTIHASVIGNEKIININMPFVTPVTEAQPVTVVEPFVSGNIFIVFVVSSSSHPSPNKKAMVWDVAKNEYAEIPDPANPSSMLTFPCDWSKVSDLVSLYSVDHVHGDPTKIGDPAYEDFCFVSEYTHGISFWPYGTAKADYPATEIPPDADIATWTPTSQHECHPGIVDYNIYDPQPLDVSESKAWPGPCGNRTDTMVNNVSYTGEVRTYAGSGESTYQAHSTYRYDIQARKNESNSPGEKGSPVGSQYGFVNTSSGNGAPVCLKVKESHESTGDYLQGIDHTDAPQCPQFVWTKLLKGINTERVYEIDTPVGTFPVLSQFERSETSDTYQWNISSNNGSLSIEKVVNEQTNKRVLNAFSFNMNGFYKQAMYQVYHYIAIKETVSYHIEGTSWAEDSKNYSRESHFMAGCDYFEDGATNHNPSSQSRNSTLESALDTLYSAALIEQGLEDEELGDSVRQFLIEVT